MVLSHGAHQPAGLWTQPNLREGVGQAFKVLLLHLSSFQICPNLDARVSPAWLSHWHFPWSSRPTWGRLGLRSTESRSLLKRQRAGLRRESPGPRTQRNRVEPCEKHLVHLPSLLQLRSSLLHWLGFLWRTNRTTPKNGLRCFYVQLHTYIRKYGLELQILTYFPKPISD